MPTPGSSQQVLVIDVGTSRIRASALDKTGTIPPPRVNGSPSSSPPAPPGIVEFDAAAMARSARTRRSCLQTRRRSVAAIGNRGATCVEHCLGCGQRSPDRTRHRMARRPERLGTCLALRSQGDRALTESIGDKPAFQLGQIGRAEHARLRFGTVETYIAWCISRGECHATNRTNAAVTGLLPSRCQRMGSNASPSLH